MSGVVAIDLYLNSPDAAGPETTAAVGEVAALVGQAPSDDIAGDTDLVLGLPSSFRSLPIAARHRVGLAIGYVSAHAGTTASPRPGPENHRQPRPHRRAAPLPARPALIRPHPTDRMASR